MEKENMILKRTFDFSVAVVNYCLLMIKDNEFVVSKQLMKAGTSVGANMEEAQGAISKADFISKMTICLKEARESNFWLRLIDKSNLSKYDNFNFLLQESLEIKNIIGK